ncbi:MAG: hydrogenase maturation protease [Thermoguttaceae bacterium]
MTTARILIAGVGNIFLGDDAFGVEVAQRLLRRRLPKSVRVVDFGIRGVDLMYAFADGYETVILVDAASRGDPPGTLYIIEPDVRPSWHESLEPELSDMHSLDPASVLRMAQTLGKTSPKVLLVACEPQPASDGGDPPIGLSPPVQRAVDEAVRVVRSTVARLLRSHRSRPPRPQTATAT